MFYVMRFAPACITLNFIVDLAENQDLISCLNLLCFNPTISHSIRT